MIDAPTIPQPIQLPEDYEIQAVSVPRPFQVESGGRGRVDLNKEVWPSVRLLAPQRGYLESKTRFNIAYAGRRSFKTKAGKRRTIMKALRETRFSEGRFICAAPTHAQAIRIFWRDMKRMIPPRFVQGGNKGIRESDKSIPLINGLEIQVVGLDKPERIEGSPLIHIHIDEIANVKRSAWDENISPALMDTMGTADFTGVPEGIDHLHEMVKTAEADDTGEWASWTWTSEDALPLYLGMNANRELLPEALRDLSVEELGIELAKRELSSARKRMDELTYQQEILGRFVLFSGRAYYKFFRNVQAAHVLPYDPKKPLYLCFDFNVDPGVCGICQDFGDNELFDGCPEFTGVVAEVYIPRNSNTEAVCDKLCTMFLDSEDGPAELGNHQSKIYCYGDATGGARKSSSTTGSDWDQIKMILYRNFGSERVYMKNRRSNPTERARVNSMNSRIQNMDQEVHLRVCPKKAPRTVEDLEGTCVLEGGSGQIDKKANDGKFSHVSDGIGYMVHLRFPLRGKGLTTSEQI